MLIIILKLRLYKKLLLSKLNQYKVVGGLIDNTKLVIFNWVERSWNHIKTETRFKLIIKSAIENT